MKNTKTEKLNDMRELQERILKGINSIIKAKLQGQDTSEWENHLCKLIQGANREKRIRVKMGSFGFCTCHLGGGLCTGCWKIKNACVCRELEVNPEETINEQLAKNVH